MAGWRTYLAPFAVLDGFPFAGAAVDYGKWLALIPSEPGVKTGLSCCTVASLCEADSSTIPSLGEAQAEIRNAIAKSETVYDAKRGIIGTNLTSDTFDASRGVR